MQQLEGQDGCWQGAHQQGERSWHRARAAQHLCLEPLQPRCPAPQCLPPARPALHTRGPRCGSCGLSPSWQASRYGSVGGPASRLS
jgi:hypothetical protein